MEKISKIKLRDAMIAACVGVNQLARMANVNVHTIIKFLKSNSKIRLSTLGKLSRALNISPEDLIISEEEMLMKIIEPSVELMREIDGAEVMKFIERCGRTCYQSEKNITEDSAEKFVRNLIKRGHESVLEHFSCTFKIICDRGVMAELTRHRLASFSIESTRYNNYDELTFIKPCFWKEETNAYVNFEFDMQEVEKVYLNWIEEGARPEQARAFLPNSLKTEIVMTANLREWRHILKLRTAKSAHPQMHQVAGMILAILKEKLPVIFEDIGA